MANAIGTVRVTIRSPPAKACRNTDVRVECTTRWVGDTKPARPPAKSIFVKILILSHPNDWHAVCNHSVSRGGSANMETRGVRAMGNGHALAVQTRETNRAASGLFCEICLLSHSD